MVLEVCAFVAAGAAIAFTTIRDWHNAHSCEWFQGFTRLDRTEALHDREGRRSGRIAEETYTL